MAESTMSLKYDELVKEIAHFLGYGYATPSGDKLTTCQQIQNIGLRQFYFPPPIETRKGEEHEPHQWSFLRPITSIIVWPTIQAKKASGISTVTITVATPETESEGIKSSMAGCDIQFWRLSMDIVTASYDAPTDKTTVTMTTKGSATERLSADMVGMIWRSGSTDYTITDVDSTLVLKVEGDASGESGTCWVHADDDADYETYVGNKYTIESVTDDATIVLTASAADEVVGGYFQVIADGSYGLPDNFGSLESPLTFEASTHYPPLTTIGEAEVRARQQRTTTAGRPQFAALRARSAPTTGQRWDLLLTPTPDAEYTLWYRYVVLMDALTAGQYPLGGMQHAEAIRASCLAAAEERENDQRGAKWDEFITKLTAAIALDKTITSPEFFGSHSPGEPLDRHTLHRDIEMTHEGISYLNS